ncbi:hypothetical protein QCB44_00550 [Thiomicrorhabdus sp. zzn3]|uniref:hypothetical protein n=1 Tax=Thiomicrorhabdus sp. zzn3 TaxID=3039775 RepID=UPI002436D09D|nr:hypothetical protein [Thiomicrorhabdus sp. zzn3]MDG6777185.1 hypothetical protein [Thiomicrorhabdus sp. zzn3]
MKPRLIAHSAAFKRQQKLAKQCYWDEVEQTLWIDARTLYPEAGVVQVMGWDRMMLDSEPIPSYPEEWMIFQWSSYSQLAYWRKQIPKWVQDSCALFPSHQLTLVHYCGKYPQLLELLDHAPLLAWRLVASELEEPEIVALLSGKRVDMVTQVGWPGKDETVKFLRNLRLRWVNQEIAEQVEVCLLDDKRLQALQNLPRINSMALSLAARFPELIGCRLHRALAQLPCRPMQCQSMVALLEDAYRLAEHLGLPEQEVARIGDSRYLVEVEQLYQSWLNTELEEALQGDEESMPGLMEQLQRSHKAFMRLTQFEQWVQLSMHQQHAWLTDFTTDTDTEGAPMLIAWIKENEVWAALIERGGGEAKIARVRGEENRLPDAAVLADLHLWQAHGLFH